MSKDNRDQTTLTTSNDHLDISSFKNESISKVISSLIGVIGQKTLVELLTDRLSEIIDPQIIKYPDGTLSEVITIDHAFRPEDAMTDDEFEKMVLEKKETDRLRSVTSIKEGNLKKVIETKEREMLQDKQDVEKAISQKFPKDYNPLSSPEEIFEWEQQIYEHDQFIEQSKNGGIIKLAGAKEALGTKYIQGNIQIDLGDLTRTTTSHLQLSLDLIEPEELKEQIRDIEDQKTRCEKCHSPNLKDQLTAMWSQPTIATTTTIANYEKLDKMFVSLSKAKEILHSYLDDVIQVEDLEINKKTDLDQLLRVFNYLENMRRNIDICLNKIEGLL